MKYIVERNHGYGWDRSSDLPKEYDTREEAQDAIDNHSIGVEYRVSVLPGSGTIADKKLERIQAVLNSKTKAEQIQDILNEE
jgi:hypothetical protein